MTVKTLPGEAEVRSLAERLCAARRTSTPAQADDLRLLDAVLADDTLCRIYFTGVDRAGFASSAGSLVTEAEAAVIAERGLMGLSEERCHAVVTDSIALADLRVLLTDARLAAVEARFRAGLVVPPTPDRPAEPVPQLMALRPGQGPARKPSRTWKRTHQLAEADFRKRTIERAVLASLSEPVQVEFDWTNGPPTLSVRLRHPFLKIGYAGTTCSASLRGVKPVSAAQTPGQVHFEFLLETTREAVLSAVLVLEYECEEFTAVVRIPLRAEDVTS